ncbi:lactonase family protein [Bacillus sp. FJAT-49705]|uniref:Lactonase family protein n=1 Tax=Cytobacillus citreus TaxID=2833586 RepID=A0ABS5NW98_9BACI|nr:lactonase family protein [Cytobacillus citreus]MBS4192110.1 lactonase family protein [Cytobacillus citreus]
MKNNKYIGYVGTYTNEKSEGIYSFILDGEKGQLSEVKLAAKLDNPTYLAISEDHQFLYSIIKEGSSGGVVAFKINPESAELQALNQNVSEGAPPCHVSVHRDNSTLFSANYHKGTVESYLLNTDNGSVYSPTSVIEHIGSGPDERQEKAHTHYAGITPDEKYVIAVDLGIDKIFTYTVHRGELTEKNSLSVKPGSGPRHLVFHPNGKYAYIMTEFSSEIIVSQYDSNNGEFTQIQIVSTLPENFKENNQGSAIHISSDGRFIYAGNRGHDSIAVFSVHSETGELQFIEHTSTEGHWPRDFVLDPTEKFIVASNQKSNNLVLFLRNEMSGKLTLLQSNIFVSEPVCIKFITD